MRKQVTFEQNGSDTCLVNIKNIFGYSINYIDDRILKHNGKWNPKYRRFEVPLSQMPALTRQMRQIDRYFYIEPVLPLVTEMLSQHTHATSKIKKQLLVDDSFVQRYSYVEDNLVKNIRQWCQGPHKNKHYDKILVVTMECKVLSWIQSLPSCGIKKMSFENLEPQMVVKEACAWICSFQALWSKADQLHKYCFETIIIDEAEVLAEKLHSRQASAVAFRKFVLTRHFVFPIITKLWLNRLQLLVPLLNLISPQINFQWFPRRYKRQNTCELNFILKKCGLYRSVNVSNQHGTHQHYFNKWVIGMSERCVDKIKTINKKYSNVQQRKVLENPSNGRNKNERLYLESIQELLKQEKFQHICKTISYLCSEKNLRLAIIIETCSMYRLVQNFLCEHQIQYCHYEHHHEVLEFNKNPSVLVCLVKMQYLCKINFTSHLYSSQEFVNSKLDNYEPEQYLCLSGVRNAIFPDIDWFNEIKAKEGPIRELFRHSNSDLVRHYFILQGTYEERWMKQLEEFLTTIQMNIKVKQDLLELQEEDSQPDCNEDPAFSFCDLNLAQIQQEYSHLKVLKGVTDIDEEFDLIEYEALKQKQEMQSRNKRKRAKKSLALVKSDSAGTSEKVEKDRRQDQSDLQSIEEYQQGGNKLRKRKAVPNRQKLPQKATIYQPIEAKKSLLPVKNIFELTKEEKTKKTKQLVEQAEQVKGETGAIKTVDEQKIIAQITEAEKCPLGQDEFLDSVKQDETEEVQIIQVRRPAKSQRIPKQKSRSMAVILHPAMMK